MFAARLTFSLTFPVLLLLAGPGAGAQSIVGTGRPADGSVFLPYSPGALSGDGLTVYGRAGNQQGYFWTAAAGFTDMGFPPGQNALIPGGVNESGMVFAGHTYGANNFRGFRWTAESGFQDLGLLPGGTWCQVHGISGNGNVVVGQANNGTSVYRAIRWSAGNLLVLPRVTGSISDAVATSTNADGSVVVGHDFVGNPGAGYRGFRWTAAGGAQMLMPLAGLSSAKATCVSSNGAVVAGMSFNNSGSMFPVTWNAAGVITNLGLPAGMTEAEPSAISADGSVIGLLAWSGGPVAGLWTAASGTVNLNTYLPTIGVDSSHWFLTRTYGVSSDGRRITGEGAFYDEQGVPHSDAWIITLPCLTAPTIAAHPAPVSVCPLGTATFTASGAGTGIDSYRWQWQPAGEGGEWVNLVEGENSFGGESLLIAGDPASATLSVSLKPANGEVARQVRCIVGNPCGTVVSNPAVLSVIHRCGAADIGGQGGEASACGDGVLNNNDFVVYIDAFFRGDLSADLGATGGVPGADGVLDNNDFVVFIDLFFTGC